MNLEAIVKATEAVSDEVEAVSEVPVSDAVEVSDDTQSDEAVEAEEVIASSVPTGDDPAEWEAFLAAEGMAAELDDETDGDDELFGSFED